MCGIVGVISKSKFGLYKGHLDTFTQMLWVDQLRGTDGTGVFWDNGKTCSIAKTPDSADHLIGYKNYESACEEAIKTSMFMVGHNRAATKGKKSWKNTHPFQEGNITLVHNGTLYTHKELDDKVDVDSHAICKYMDKHGVEKTIKNTNGAFALVWHDAQDNTLNLCRNSQRPLHLVETISGWFISSESGIATMCIDRNNMNVVSIHQLAVGKLYQFDLSEACDKYETYDLELYKYVSTNNSYHSNFPTQNKALPPPKRESSPKQRAFGERVRFSPLEYFNQEQKKLTALHINQNTQLNWSHWMHGLVEGEDNSYVKVFAPLLQLKEWEKAKLLEGTITLSIVRGTNHIYNVENVVEIVEETKELLCVTCNEPITTKDLTKCESVGNDYNCPDCTAFYSKASGYAVWPYN